MDFSVLLKSFIVFGVFYFYFSEADERLQCVVYEFCFQPDGMSRAVQCASLMSEKTHNVTKRLIAAYFDYATDIPSFVEECCADIKKASQKINAMYDRVLNMSLFEAGSSEELMRFSLSKGCITAVVSQCQLKVMMGLVRFNATFANATFDRMSYL